MVAFIIYTLLYGAFLDAFGQKESLSFVFDDYSGGGLTQKLEVKKFAN
jgi:hypothetical protein